MQLGDAYAEALAEHRRQLRRVPERHGGIRLDTQGDAFFVAFPRAGDALAAAAEGQRVLKDGPIRGADGCSDRRAERPATEEGYAGIDVHRAARYRRCLRRPAAVLRPTTSAASTARCGTSASIG